MHNVFIDRFRQYSYVILIGSDCPFLGGDYVTDAINRLKQGVPAVFGPATDGGYVLIGLSRVDVSLFEGIQWGTDEVMAQTRDRLRALDWQWEELPINEFAMTLHLPFVLSPYPPLGMDQAGH